MNFQKQPAQNKFDNKCKFLNCVQETATLSCVFVETFEIFTYIFSEINGITGQREPI